MPTTTKGFRYPALTGAPNVPQHFRDLAEDADAYFDTAAGRARTCTSGSRPAHEAGLLAYETDTGWLIFSTGAAWKYLYRDTGWLVSGAGTFTYSSGYSTSLSSVRIRRIGDVLYLRGLVRPDSGTIAAGGAVAFTLDAAYRPATDHFIGGADVWVAGAAVEHIGDGALKVAASTGAVTVYTPRTTTGLFLDGITIPLA